MAQVKQLKDVLESSFISYKRHLSGLSRAIKTTPVLNTRVLKSKIDLLDEALNTLNSAHTSWVSKVDLSAEDLSAQTFSNQWLEERWAEADTVLDEANILVHAEEEKLAPPSLQHKQKLAVLEKQMRSLQVGIQNRIKTLLEQTSREAIPSASHTVFSTMVEEVGKQLGRARTTVTNALRLPVCQASARMCIGCAGSRFQLCTQHAGSPTAS